MNQPTTNVVSDWSPLAIGQCLDHRRLWLVSDSIISIVVIKALSLPQTRKWRTISWWLSLLLVWNVWSRNRVWERIRGRGIPKSPQHSIHYLLQSRHDSQLYILFWFFLFSISWSYCHHSCFHHLHGNQTLIKLASTMETLEHEVGFLSSKETKKRVRINKTSQSSDWSYLARDRIARNLGETHYCTVRMHCSYTSV